METFISREWKAGDVYSPHDLSPAETRKWNEKRSPSKDAFDTVNVNPLDLYKVESPLLDWQIENE